MSRSARVGCALAAAGALVATYAVWLGANKSGTPVEFVVPDGYAGPVILMLDPKDGMEITRQDGKYMILIPADGFLRVRSFDPLERWHEETWTYAGGRIIPDAKLAAQPDPDRVMLRGGNSAESEGVRWIEHFVGTESQLHKHLQTSFGPPKQPPPAHTK
jgi:hypothetical protein